MRFKFGDLISAIGAHPTYRYTLLMPPHHMRHLWADHVPGPIFPTYGPGMTPRGYELVTDIFREEEIFQEPEGRKGEDV